MPHDIDLSALFYNKVLFTKAGLDPEKPPTTLDELYTDAKKINALGGNVHGYNFGGACPGCMLFTTWPMIWASGVDRAQRRRAPRRRSTTRPRPGSTRSTARCSRRGSCPAAAKNEAGPTWTQDFADGTIGIQPMGATSLQGIKESADLQVGVAADPRPHRRHLLVRRR